MKMKKLKLFPKTFFYTLGIMLLVVVTGHILLYLLAPKMQITIAPGQNKTDDTAHGLTFDSGQNEIDDIISELTIGIAEEKIVVQAIQKALPVSIGCSVLISIICSFGFSRAIVKPVQLISASTGQMMILDKLARCPVCAADEIGVLAQNVNDLYASLLSAIEHLEHEKDTVRQIEQSRTDFLRAASHELKTPVTALSVTLENMILGVGKYRDYETYLPECREMTDQISAMIHEILEASKLNRVTELAAPVMTDVSELVAQLCEPYQLIAAAHQISFCVDLPPTVSVLLSVEPFQKAVSNILANAAAYTELGKKVSIYMNGHSLVIENECKPIPDAEIPRLFQPFYRPDFSRSRESGGNGLGLYIVDLLLQSMKMSYSFEAMESPKGMRFTIDLGTTSYRETVS